MRLLPFNTGSFWIPVAILMQGLLYGFFLYLFVANYQHPLLENGRVTLYVFSADTETYTRPIENLISHGQYIADVSKPWSSVIRMPGYGSIYLFLRFFSDPHQAKNLLVLLQVFLSGIAVYYLSYTAVIVCKRKAAFYITFILYGSSGLVQVYNAYPQSDSLCNSFIIYSLFLLLTSVENQEGSIFFSKKRLFFSGCCLAFASFLRPATVPLFFLFSLYVLATLLYTQWKLNRIAALFSQVSKAIVYVLLFTGVFILLEAIWIYRNYSYLHTLVPFQYNYWIHTTGKASADVQAYAYKWVVAMGEVNIEYEPGSLAAWLHNNEFVPPGYELPQHIYTSAFNADSLLHLRNSFIAYENKYGFVFKQNEKIQQNSLNTITRESEALKLNQAFEAYKQAYKTEKPVDYYIKNPLRLLKKFTVHTGTGLLPFKLFSTMLSDKDFIGIAAKVFFALNYLLVMLFGSIGVLLFIMHASFSRLLIVSCIAYGLFIFPFFVGTIDIRFLSLAFPFFIITAGHTLSLALEKVSLKK